jgi:hypothetical protein
MKPPLLLPMDFRVILRSKPLWMLWSFRLSLGRSSLHLRPHFLVEHPVPSLHQRACSVLEEVYFFKTIRAA